MAKLRLREAAAADLAEILEDSVERFGEPVAEDYLRSFEHAFDRLRDYPRCGALRTDLDPPIRSLSHRSHRIFYDIEGETIWIVRILHHAMDERPRLGG